MSLCDTCRNPGRCCTGFHLTTRADTPNTYLDALILMATIDHADGTWLRGRALGLPFMPLVKRSGAWLYWCPLLKDGRCSDYENRPQLCRTFEPGSDTLCVEATAESVERKWLKDWMAYCSGAGNCHAIGHQAVAR
jgi:Fe-S-cluster containining protein